MLSSIDQAVMWERKPWLGQDCPKLIIPKSIIHQLIALQGEQASFFTFSADIFPVKGLLSKFYLRCIGEATLPLLLLIYTLYMGVLLWILEFICCWILFSQEGCPFSYIYNKLITRGNYCFGLLCGIFDIPCS